jgi:hypothetical protein
MRIHRGPKIWPKFNVLVATLSVAALVAAPVATAAPTPVATAAPAAVAPPGLGAIPLAFLRNQGQYCSVICPYAVQGAVTVPIGAVLSPAAFLGALLGTGSLTRSLGAAAASITGPANAAFTPIIDNDLVLVLPKAQNALQVAVVEAFNIGAAVLQPAGLLSAVQTARSRILAALDQPIGVPVGPTGARTILQVAAVEVINVASAILFQAGELLLLGVVQSVVAAAQELASSGNPVAAVAAGAATAVSSVRTATDRVVGAVNTAVANIGVALRDPFPSTPAEAATTDPVDAADTAIRVGTQTVTEKVVGTDEERRAPVTDHRRTGLVARQQPLGRSDPVDAADTAIRVGTQTVTEKVVDTDEERRAPVTHHRRTGLVARPQPVSQSDPVNRNQAGEAEPTPDTPAAPGVRPATTSGDTPRASTAPARSNQST